MNLLKNINVFKKSKQNEEKIKKQESDIDVLLPVSYLNYITMAMDKDIEDSLDLIAKTKNTKDLPDFILKYNNLNLLKEQAINSDVNGMNAMVVYFISEDNKQLLISSLIRLKNDLKLESKKQDDKEFEETCSRIHDINQLINIIQNAFNTNIEEA